MNWRTNSTVLAVALTVASGCDVADSGGAEALPAAEALAPAAIVDSIHPIEEEIRRFAQTVDREPTTLAGGASSRDELVEGFVRALVAADTAALAAALLDRAEFIHLYFPQTVYTRPPYEMDPAFIWFQMANNSSRGLSRALRQFGSASLDFQGYTCGPAIQEGPNRLWDGCIVRIALGGGTATQLRLFGLIMERGDHYKFVSYGNDL